MTHPVSFTDAAVNHIKKMLQQTPQGAGFRLSVKKTGCSGYSYVPAIAEKAAADDISYLVQDNLLIYIDKASLPFLEALQVDFVIDEVQGLKQKRLIFINPNEKARCGCGESFTIE